MQIELNSNGNRPIERLQRRCRERCDSLRRQTDIRPYLPEGIHLTRTKTAGGRYRHCAEGGFPLNLYWATHRRHLRGDGRTAAHHQHPPIWAGVHSVRPSTYSKSISADGHSATDTRLKLMVYSLCTGAQRNDWFKTINIAGERLTDQELRNAVYHGHGGRCQTILQQDGLLPTASATTSPARHPAEFLETVIRWISDGHIDHYMAEHQQKDSTEGFVELLQPGHQLGADGLSLLGNERGGLGLHSSTKYGTGGAMTPPKWIRRWHGDGGRG